VGAKLNDSEKKTQMLVRVDSTTARLMKVLAAANGESLSAVAERAFTALLAKEGVSKRILRNDQIQI
jgi:predicted HicB family RNase H-like nuclease